MGALALSYFFGEAIVSEASGVVSDPDETVIMNQKYDSDTGITDIEITDHSTFYLIIEAKRGWILPGADQLTRYSLRKDFVASSAKKKAIVTIDGLKERIPQYCMEISQTLGYSRADPSSDFMFRSPSLDYIMSNM